MFEQKNIGIKLNFSILLQGFLINDCQAQSCNFYLHFILKILQKTPNNNTTCIPRYI
jgi:hypothetical protein